MYYEELIEMQRVVLMHRVDFRNPYAANRHWNAKMGGLAKRTRRCMCDSLLDSHSRFLLETNLEKGPAWSLHENPSGMLVGLPEAR